LVGCVVVRLVVVGPVFWDVVVVGMWGSCKRNTRR
jgi:hypothetical protein